jgi:chemotaxis protein CheX
MNVKFLNPFVEAAHEVLQAESNLEIRRSDLVLEKEPYVTEDVTVIISLVGQVEGNVFYSMNQAMAISLAERMLGESLGDFSMLAQSGIAELGNVITGRASVKLDNAGFKCTISPPTLLRGSGAVISTLDYARLVVPLVSEVGRLVIHLALRENAWLASSRAVPVVADKPNLD